MAKSLVIEAFRWLLIPSVAPEHPMEIIWDRQQLQNTGSNTIGAGLNRVLSDSEAVITKWAPVHMRTLLNSYYWKNSKEVGAQKLWQDMCRYLYMARLRKRSTFTDTLYDGAKTKENWALATGRDGDKYAGFVFGGSSMQYFDGETLVIERETALAYEARTTPPPPPPPPPPGEIVPGEGGSGGVNGLRERGGGGLTVFPVKKTRYHAVVHIDPVVAKMQMDEIAREIIVHLAKLDQTDVRIDIEINVDTRLPHGFPLDMQRIIKENANELKKQMGFEISEFE
ncbi:MAG: hypothetical protein J5855_01155 [Mailhella sp.]|nr:hypothetical protein [Mailhella sp.]